MLKRLLCLLALLAIPAAALTEPLVLLDDLQGTVYWPEGGTPCYTYTYAYPQVAGDDMCAQTINAFYQYEEANTLLFTVPIRGEGIQDPTLPAATQVSYRITANTDELFCVLVITDSVIDGERQVSVSAQTFGRSTEKPGNVLTLPFLLDIVQDDEDSDWLKDRQTGQANEVVRSLVWEEIRAMDNVPDFWDEEMLQYDFFPEEDFYYDGENDCLVFFFQPYMNAEGADPASFWQFPIPIDDILDEM